MRSWDQIAALTTGMMNDQSAIVQKMREVNLRYRGDYAIPFPDLATEPELPPLTPMLVGEAIDQLGMRAAQVDPLLRIPALNNDSETSRRKARRRHDGLHAVYKASMWPLQRARAFRQLVAYNTTSLVVVPDFRQNLPLVQVRDPLSTFAERVDESTPRPPSYVAFVTRHSGEYLRRKYPATCAELGGCIAKKNTERMWEVVEWIDEDQTLFGLLGPIDTAGEHIADNWVRSGMKPSMQLAGPFPNMAGCGVAVVPRQVTLSGLSSRIGNMLGMVDLQAKMQGLEILAQQKAIFPDMYAIGTPNGDPSIVGGHWKDGTEGDINLLRDIQQVGQINSQPPQSTAQTIDRMERAFRTSTGLSPMFGGETYGALRTGRAIDAMTNMSVDPRVMELHKVMASWQPYINAAVLATWKGMWPGRKYTLFTGLPGDRGMVSLTPERDIEVVDNTIEYPFPGADVTMQTQILGSLLGTKGISRRSFRDMHPWIGDPEGEEELVKSEELEEALMASVLQQISTGALPLPVLAILHEKVEKGTPLMRALREAQQELQEQQATAAPPAPEGMVAAPEAMPGLAAGPQAMMQPAAEPAIDTQPDVARMRQLMQTMRAG